MTPMERRDPWDGYRWRRNQALAVAGLAGPVMFSIIPLASEHGLGFVSVLLFLVWPPLLIAASGRWVDFPCPGCGKPFFEKRSNRFEGWPDPFPSLDELADRDFKPFTAACLNCGLPKWVDPAELDDWQEPA
jgi:hypothetical protein